MIMILKIVKVKREKWKWKVKSCDHFFWHGHLWCGWERPKGDDRYCMTMILSLPCHHQYDYNHLDVTVMMIIAIVIDQEWSTLAKWPTLCGSAFWLENENLLKKYINEVILVQTSMIWNTIYAFTTKSFAEFVKIFGNGQTAVPAILKVWCNDQNDLKVTMEAQLGLIGGTMGLLTGFSILRCLHHYQQFYPVINHAFQRLDCHNQGYKTASHNIMIFKSQSSNQSNHGSPHWILHTQVSPSLTTILSGD